MNIKLVKQEGLSTVTEKVFDDFNELSDQEFMNLYQCSKAKYLKRVSKHGDPYMKGTLAKIRKALGK